VPYFSKRSSLLRGSVFCAIMGLVQRKNGCIAPVFLFFFVKKRNESRIEVINS